jgi:hypothetical protein
MRLPSHFIYIKSFTIWHLDVWKALVTSIFSYAPLQFNIQVTVMLPEAIPNLQDISWKFLQLVQFELMSQYDNLFLFIKITLNFTCFSFAIVVHWSFLG